MKPDCATQNLLELCSFLAARGLVNTNQNNGFIQYAPSESAWPLLTVQKNGGKLNNEELQLLPSFLRQAKNKGVVLVNEEGVDALVLDSMKNAGLVPVARWVNMECEIGNMAPDDNSHCNTVRIEKEDTSRIDDWLNIVSKVLFKSQPLDKNIFFEGIASGKLELLLGYSQNEPVSAAMAFLGETAGIYMVSVLPDYRKTGQATKMMKALHHVLAHKKYTSVALQSTKEGYPLYSKMGYKEISKSLLLLLKEQ